ncbi:L-amino acid N-acyltransferase YncA [Bacillus sp. SORGH_AS 510]|uniref:GNAT family N-acetyltransferase n=1 Tax=Bacillus sp. SORGH_AS_0510 TaxID=3041771 RepID=UPI002783B9D7|nr:GNAT family N-acetyltransferase [Bacillus sp. SORGH_AS_0510]MDQ1147652.1 L-amino acid N-acyltransferase YncA [Bacillus sp. SORGH_AS_0510]
MNIRKAVLSDAKGIARVHVDSWRTTYANIMTEDYLNQLSYEKREEMWNIIIPNGGVYVAENNEGTIVGFSSGGKERLGEYPGFSGELYAIYILKEYQGKGLGKALVKPIVKELQDQQIDSMVVCVLEENNSRLFYEALCGKKIDTIEVEIGGKRLNELIYGWEHIGTLLND